MTSLRSAFTVPQFFHLTGLVVITPFGLWMLLQGQMFWGALILLASITSGVSFFLESIPGLDTLGRLLAAVIPGFVVLNFLSYTPQYAMLWSFPLVVYFYFQLVLPLAITLNLLFFAAAMLIIPDSVSVDVLARYIAAHIIIGMFSTAFSYDRMRKEQELTRLAHFDDLTGLPNRREILNKIEEWSNRAKRYDEKGVLLFIDADEFKMVNDNYGHTVGDQVLIDLAALLSTRIRSTDLIGRLGGEEFIALLDKVSAEEALAIADELLVLCRNQAFAHNKTLTLSIGAAPYEAEQSVDAWIRNADQAMYQSKREGGDRITLSRSQEGNGQVDAKEESSS